MPKLPTLQMRVGCDIQDVASVEHALARFGEKYLDKVLGTGRPVDIRPRATLSAEFLAGRFAAKEAVFKLLSADANTAVPWPSIDIKATPTGPTVVLTGEAEALASRHQTGGFSVSISHSSGFAMAVAAATSTATSANPSMNPASEYPQQSNAVSLPSPRSFMNESTIDSVIRKSLEEHARLAVEISTLEVETDLYSLGMTSHASVSVMLSLEDHLDFEFPEQALKRSTFSSILNIRNTLTEILL